MNRGMEGLFGLGKWQLRGVVALTSIVAIWSVTSPEHTAPTESKAPDPVTVDSPEGPVQCTFMDKPVTVQDGDTIDAFLDQTALITAGSLATPDRNAAARAVMEANHIKDPKNLPLGNKVFIAEFCVFAPER